MIPERDERWCIMGHFISRWSCDKQVEEIEVLNSRGVAVHDFGTNFLYEGCYGEDVNQLQRYLQEEGASALRHQTRADFQHVYMHLCRISFLSSTFGIQAILDPRMDAPATLEK